MIHVDEILTAMRETEGLEWDGFACGHDGARLYRWLCPLSNGPRVQISFASPCAYWSGAFFSVLLPLMANDQECEWMVDVLSSSDISDDVELMRLARVAVA